jgi:isopentenyl-diphosphate delta-isomerase
LTEHEYDHVLVGRLDGHVTPDPAEVADVKWMESRDLLADVKAHPQHYTPWFKIVLERVLDTL